MHALVPELYTYIVLSQFFYAMQILLSPTERRYTTHHITIHDSYTAINVNNDDQFDYMCLLYNNYRSTIEVRKNRVNGNSIVDYLVVKCYNVLINGKQI